MLQLGGTRDPLTPLGSNLAPLVFFFFCATYFNYSEIQSISAPPIFWFYLRLWAPVIVYRVHSHHQFVFSVCAQSNDKMYRKHHLVGVRRKSLVSRKHIVQRLTATINYCECLVREHPIYVIYTVNRDVYSHRVPVQVL